MYKSVVFAFARMNPPTMGHEILIEGVHSWAKEYNADHLVFLSLTQNHKTDPLAWTYKVRACKSAFPSTKFSRNTTIRTPHEALKHLIEKYDKIVFVVGSDRRQEFEDRLTPYAKQWGCNDFIIKCAGKRNPDADDATGMSASKLRDFARQNKATEFIDGLPYRLNTLMKNQVYLHTVKGLVAPLKRNVALQQK